MEVDFHKITYILGAGASAKALPVNSEFTNSLRELAEDLRANSSISLSYKGFCTDLCNDLEWLANMGDEYNTIDTYARSCYIEDKDSLLRLKFTLSLFFIIKQRIENKLDNRYRNFIIKNLDRTKIFPSNIKILNWNYDCQMQLAGANFRPESYTYRLGITTYGAPLIDYYPMPGGDFNINARMDHIELSLVHLNGIAGYYFYEHTGHVQNYFLSPLKDINHLFEMVLADKERKHQLLTFAFENNDGVNNVIRKRLEYAEKIISDTDFLVVIGYSFPADNIETDMRMFEVLKKGGLKGIYYQDPQKSGQFLRNLFNLDGGITITDINSTDSFYFPNEAKIKRRSITTV